MRPSAVCPSDIVTSEIELAPETTNAVEKGDVPLERRRKQTLGELRTLALCHHPAGAIAAEHVARITYK